MQHKPSLEILERVHPLLLYFPAVYHHHVRHRIPEMDELHLKYLRRVSQERLEMLQEAEARCGVTYSELINELNAYGVGNPGRATSESALFIVEVLESGLGLMKRLARGVA